LNELTIIIQRLKTKSELKRLTEEEGLSLLVVTHDADFAKRTDRIIEMEDGCIVS